MGKYNRKKNKIKTQENKTDKLATTEQIETIKGFMSKYSIDLKRELEQLELLTEISSSKGVYNPRISEQYLQNILFNPKSATSDQINQWLLNPRSYNKEIRALSEYLETAVGQYGRSIYELNVEKSWKYMLVPSDVDNTSLLDSNDYKHSYDLALEVCRKLNIKSQFAKVDLTVMEKGVGFYLLEEKQNSITLIELPAEYCYITAPWTYGWQFAIDLVFFDKMIGLQDIMPELSVAYNLLLEKRKEGLSGDKLAPYQYYKLPIEKSFCFTFNPNRIDKTPPLTSALTSAIDVLSYRDLLRKKSLLDLFKLIALKVPLDKEGKRPIISYNEAADWISMIQAQSPENVVSFVSPFDATEISSSQVSTLDALVDLGNNNVYSSIGISPNAFGADNKNAGAIELSLETTFFFSSTHMYAQFANLVNWLIYLKTRKYKWQVSFFGMKLKHEKEIDQALSLTTGANFPIEYLMANVGIEPFQVKSFINWSNKMDLKSKMTPLQSQFTQSGESSSEGRPEKNDLDLTDAGEKSREYKDS